MEQIPGYRDRSMGLISYIHKEEVEEITGKDIHEVSAWMVLKLQADKRLTSSVSINRQWQKVQQECPELRGKTYDERHNIKEPEMRVNQGYQ